MPSSAESQGPVHWSMIRRSLACVKPLCAFVGLPRQRDSSQARSDKVSCVRYSARLVMQRPRCRAMNGTGREASLCAFVGLPRQRDSSQARNDRVSCVRYSARLVMQRPQAEASLCACGPTAAERFLGYDATQACVASTPRNDRVSCIRGRPRLVDRPNLVMLCSSSSGMTNFPFSLYACRLRITSVVFSSGITNSYRPTHKQAHRQPIDRPRSTLICFF
jgi:hypothetical protein